MGFYVGFWGGFGFEVFVVSVTMLAVFGVFGFLGFRGDLGFLWVWVLCISGFGLFWVLLVGLVC